MDSFVGSTGVPNVASGYKDAPVVNVSQESSS
jgi:hypothetical protein